MSALTKLVSVHIKQEISLKKKIYDEVTEDIFDMSNVRIFNKEIEMEKNGGYLYFAMYSVS